MVPHGIPQLITSKQHHMVPHAIPQLITSKQRHMVPHAIPQLITSKQRHMVPHAIPQLITSKQHHMHHDQIMESYTQLTPLNNYQSNCVIKLHIKLHHSQTHYGFRPRNHISKTFFNLS
jgi:K+ transporter